jgi:DNA-binding transcriptional regulator GbsR (MarR family)
VLGALFEGTPLSLREIMAETRLSSSAAGMALYRAWKAGLVLRTAEVARAAPG